MDGVKFSILTLSVSVLAAALVGAAGPAEARPPWAQRTADRPAPRWQASPALARILAQSRGQMSDAERERLRRDLNAASRERGRDGARSRDGTHMTPQQRESLRRDMRDANRQLDRKSRSGRNGDRSRSRNRDRR